MAFITTDFRARQRFEVNDPAGSSQLYTDAQLDEFRDDALGAISAVSPADKTASLSILPTTKIYGLPSDYVTVSTSRVLPNTGSTYGVYFPVPEVTVFRLDTASGGHLMVDKHFHIFGTNLILYAEPSVTETWTLYYGGTHDATTLPAKWVDALLDYATMRVYERKIVESANNFNYTTASISVNKNGIVDSWKKARDDRQKRWDAFLSSISNDLSSVGTFHYDRA